MTTPHPRCKSPVVALSCWLGALVGAAFFPAPASAARNVVLIVADDLGLQLGCYGDKNAQTPHLDRLAAAGTRFANAHCTTASCSASRSVLLTGLYNHANGQYGLEHADHHFRTKERLSSLPVLLSAAGYRTASIGKVHVGPQSVYRFDEYLNEGTQGARNTVRMAENARRFLAADDRRPFFLLFCPTDPHRSGPGQFANGRGGKYPGVTDVTFDPLRLSVPPWLPDQPETRREWAEFLSSIARLDQGVGALVDALKATGHWDDTLVIFLSDNGPPFPGAKTTLYEPGTHLPLIIRRPGSTPGIVNRTLVNWADVAPTILDFCGAAEAARRMHGRSLLPILEAERAAGWDVLFASHTFHEVTMYYPMRSVRQGDIKLILNLAHPLPFPFASDLYASLTWQGVLRRGDTLYGRRTTAALLHRPRWEAYDLAADPHELTNVVDDPRYAAKIADLRQRLRAWQEQTADPWLVKYEHE